MGYSAFIPGVAVTDGSKKLHIFIDVARESKTGTHHGFTVLEHLFRTLAEFKLSLNRQNVPT